MVDLGRRPQVLESKFNAENFAFLSRLWRRSSLDVVVMWSLRIRTSRRVFNIAGQDHSVIPIAFRCPTSFETICF